MKTTVEIPDDLYRRAKAQAALQGRKLKDLIQESLTTLLETPRHSDQPVRLAALMKQARGSIASGISDLASNADHLAGFGDDASRHR